MRQLVASVPWFQLEQVIAGCGSTNSPNAFLRRTAKQCTLRQLEEIYGNEEEQIAGGRQTQLRPTRVAEGDKHSIRQHSRRPPGWSLGWPPLLLLRTWMMAPVMMVRMEPLGRHCFLTNCDHFKVDS